MPPAATIAGRADAARRPVQVRAGGAAAMPLRPAAGTGGSGAAPFPSSRPA